MGLKTRLKYFVNVFKAQYNESLMLATGKLLTNQQLSIKSENLNDYEFKIFSQFGDDGIIQHLIKNIKIENNTFIEFGVQDYFESTTRFLMMNNNWAGFIIDSSSDSFYGMQYKKWYWMHDLRYKCVFITKENIDSLMHETGFQNLGILHINIDGNDYHILECMDLSVLNPSIIIVKYNSVFGETRSITIPYQPDFNRTKAHYSNLYFGASLNAFTQLCSRIGYSLVGSTSAGNNAYFVRKDLLNKTIKEVSVKEAFFESKFKESRDMNGQGTFLRGLARLEVIKGLPVINVAKGVMETI